MTTLSAVMTGVAGICAALVAVTLKTAFYCTLVPCITICSIVGAAYIARASAISKGGFSL